MKLMWPMPTLTSKLDTQQKQFSRRKRRINNYQKVSCWSALPSLAVLGCRASMSVDPTVKMG